MKNERIIIKDKIYRFEFLDNTLDEMREAEMSLQDLKDAFLLDEEQKEFMEGLNGDAEIVFADFNDVFFVASIEGNLIKIRKVYWM